MLGEHERRRRVFPQIYLKMINCVTFLLENSARKRGDNDWFILIAKKYFPFARTITTQ